jgi:F0F1-type ATP synthase assembly protein I
MGDKVPDSKEMGRYFTLSQIGFEMVVPIVVGLILDNKLGWAPWGVVVGAIVGLVGGLTHLVYLLKKFERTDSPEDAQ